MSLPQTPETAVSGYWDGHSVRYYRDPNSGYTYVQFTGGRSWFYLTPEQESYLER
jgi:hypothetical protein